MATCALGLPTRMRERLAPDLYLAFELEVNQRLLAHDAPALAELGRALAESLKQAIR